MTDFMVFFESGLSVLEQSNYDVLLALTELNFTNLKSNIGLYFIVGYWSLFLILCLLFTLVDRRFKKTNFYHKLFLYFKTQEGRQKQEPENKI